MLDMLLHFSGTELLTSSDTPFLSPAMMFLLMSIVSVVVICVVMWMHARCYRYAPLIMLIVLGILIILCNIL